MPELTMDEIRQLCLPTTQQSHSFQIGEKYLIRTVTMHFTGRVTAVTDSDIVLEDAAWIAHTGRFAEALATGKMEEIEPYPDRTCVARGVIVDFAVWRHDLPRSTK